MASDVVGFILAGGRGRRMGLPQKGLLRHPAGGTIVAHLLAEMEAAGIGQIVLLTGDPRPYAELGRDTLADLRQDMGPLGGVETGLHWLHTTGAAKAALFLPCDVPAITHNEITRLLDAFRSDPWGAKVARVAGDSRLQALCCVVHVDLLPAVRHALDEKRRAVQQLWRRLGAQVVVFPEEAPFRNVNTPQEHTRLLVEGRS